MKRVSAAVRAKARRIRLLLLDVDGVLTDGGIVIDDRGIETKRFDVRDGQGIALLMSSGIDVGFVTARRSKIVLQRARELGVTRVYQGVRNKLLVYQRLKRELRLQDQQIAYAGDDLGDLAILRCAGLAITVPAAGAPMNKTAHYVTLAAGGQGAVREIAELLLRTQRLWLSAIGKFLVSVVIF